MTSDEVSVGEWRTLSVHTSEPGNPVRSLAASALLGDSGVLVFRYCLRGDLARIRIAPGPSAERAHGLWAHTCFEAFIRAPGAPQYHEFNFAPSGNWAAYQFDDYRRGMALMPMESPPGIVTRGSDDRLEVDAVVQLLDLPALRGARQVQVALSAVIEALDGRLSYWALKHPQGNADFHHADGFVLEVPLPTPKS
jgi:hypothetical protein